MSWICVKSRQKINTFELIRVKVLIVILMSDWPLILLRRRGVTVEKLITWLIRFYNVFNILSHMFKWWSNDLLELVLALAKSSWIKHWSGPLSKVCYIFIDRCDFTFFFLLTGMWFQYSWQKKGCDFNIRITESKSKWMRKGIVYLGLTCTVCHKLKCTSCFLSWSYIFHGPDD